MRLTTFDARPACADRLDLVDEAFTAPGKADDLKALCAHCPIAAECLTLGMLGEDGVWGGTSPHWRARRGMPKKVNGVRVEQRVTA